MNVLKDTVKLIGFNDSLSVIFTEYLNTSEFNSLKYRNINSLLIFLFKPIVLGEWKFKILSSETVSFKINNRCLVSDKNGDAHEVLVVFRESVKHAFTILSRDQNFTNTKVYFKSPNFDEFKLLTPDSTLNLCVYLSTDDPVSTVSRDLLENGYYSSAYDQVRLKHWKFYKEYLHIADLEAL